MAMTLWFKRAKSFVAVVNGGTRKFLAQPGPTPVHNVPNWVADTPTFEYGIADQSIVNLTPPHLMPGYKAPVAVAEPDEKDPADEPAGASEDGPDDVGDDEDDLEQKEVPQAPFGGQPMTPVAPAVKVGLRANRSK